MQRLQRKHNGGKEWPGGAWSCGADNEQGMDSSTEARRLSMVKRAEDVNQTKVPGCIPSG